MYRLFTDQDSIVDIDPRTVCGYNPCVVAKCIILPYATCVSDFKCRPVFFDSEERKVTQCKGNSSPRLSTQHRTGHYLSPVVLRDFMMPPPVVFKSLKTQSFSPSSSSCSDSSPSDSPLSSLSNCNLKVYKELN